MPQSLESGCATGPRRSFVQCIPHGIAVAISVILSLLPTRTTAEPPTASPLRAEDQEQLPLPQPDTKPAEGHETEQQTIMKCLADLDSDNVDTRRRAVLVLGKYNAPIARAAMVKCLSDPDDMVRRSALVSLSELPTIPLQARTPIVRLLKDPNVHIRRIASSVLRPALTSSFIRGPLPPNVKIKSGRNTIDPETSKLLNEALDDEDPFVRKNVLALHPFAGKAFEADKLAKCFSDPDREVRVLALKAFCSNALGSGSPTPALAVLIRDPDPLVRQEVAQTLGWMGDSGKELLQMLVSDPDPGVRIKALQQLARLDINAAFEPLKAALIDASIPIDEREQLVVYLRTNPDAGKPVLMELVNGTSATLRARALRTLGGMGRQLPPIDFFQKQLSDSSAEVRRAAATVLRQHARELTPAQMTSLLASEHADVRLAAIRMALQLRDMDQTADIIMECLLDEDIEVRSNAISYAVMRKIPNWQLIMAQSLQDPSIEIQRAAIDALSRASSPDSRKILEDYRQRCTVPELKAYVQLRLDRLDRAARRAAAKKIPRPGPVLPAPRK